MYEAHIEFKGSGETEDEAIENLRCGINNAIDERDGVYGRIEDLVAVTEVEEE